MDYSAYYIDNIKVAMMAAVYLVTHSPRSVISNIHFHVKFS